MCPASRRTTSAIFAWVLSPTMPYTTCTPACSSRRAHSMFEPSSKRAFSSISATTSLPACAARISARTIGLSRPEVR